MHSYDDATTMHLMVLPSIFALTASRRRLRQNFDVCAIFRKFLAVFLRFRRFSDVFGCVRIHSDAFGYIRMRSDAFGCVRKFRKIFGSFPEKIDIQSTILNVFGGFRRFSDVFGCIRMHSEVFGSFRNFSFFLICFGEILEFFRRVRIKLIAKYTLSKV